GNTGSGTGNTGNSGTGNSGSGGRGTGNSGNTGSTGSGTDNLAIGPGNTGNSGTGNSGTGNTGNSGSGTRNTGSSTGNTGNSGTGNTGNSGTGNRGRSRTTNINGINKDVKVIATGTGEATVKMVSLYYALPKEKESDCQMFNLYKDNDSDATMSILDIGLLTGFTVNTNDLDLLSKGRSRIIARYEMNTVLSERGSLIIYLDKVSHTRPEEISFRIHQKLKVGVLQPAAVSVYEYYDQTHCVKFYHPERKAGKLLQLCTDDECTCAEENCSMQNKDKLSNDQRTALVCETTQTSRIDFVYKVRLDSFTEDLTTDIFTVKVLEVIKEGRRSLALGTGKTYLVMGTSKDIHRDDQHQSFQYVFGETTWIEYWPTEAECQTQKHRLTCLGLEEMVHQYQLFGCQQ
ncbi:hypothetical protein FQN60_001625, partial [Etheostoma spectabile]